MNTDTNTDTYTVQLDTAKKILGVYRWDERDQAVIALNENQWEAENDRGYHWNLEVPKNICGFIIFERARDGNSYYDFGISADFRELRLRASYVASFTEYMWGRPSKLHYFPVMTVRDVISELTNNGQKEFGAEIIHSDNQGNVLVDILYVKGNVGGKHYLHFLDGRLIQEVKGIGDEEPVLDKKKISAAGNMMWLCQKELQQYQAEDLLLAPHLANANSTTLQHLVFCYSDLDKKNNPLPTLRRRFGGVWNYHSKPPTLPISNVVAVYKVEIFEEGYGDEPTKVCYVTHQSS